MDPLIGRNLGPYEIESRLGGGGMGGVYCGVHRLLRQRRAVKVMVASLAGDQNFVSLFRSEARLAAELRHPNIVQIYDVAEQDGVHYIVMELLEGRSLRDVVDLQHPLPLGRVVVILQQLGAALDHAHQHGVTHHDVKPANIFVSADDHVTLVDFGIARAMDGGVFSLNHAIGTPAYMAPETFNPRLAGPEVDAHRAGVNTDRYALGVVAYELLTGQVPFAGRSNMEMAFDQVNTPPPPPRVLRPDVPEAVEQVVLQQLSKRPSERYSSTSAFATGLAEAVTLVTGLEHGHQQSADSDEPTLHPSILSELKPRRSPGDAESDTQPFGVLGVADQGTTDAAEDAGEPAVNAEALPDVLPALPSDASSAPVSPSPESVRGRSIRPLQRAMWVRRAGIGVVGLALLIVVILISRPADDPSPAPAVSTSDAFSAASTVSVSNVQATPGIVATTVPATAVPAAAVPSTVTAVPRTATPAALQQLQIAESALHAGDFPGALRLLGALHQSDPSTIGLAEIRYRAHLDYGRQLLGRGDLDASYAQFDEALVLRRDDPAALDGQKLVVLQKHWSLMESTWETDDVAAIAALDEIMALDAEYRDARQKLYALLITQADRLLEAGDGEGAFQVLMRAMEVAPNSAEAQVRLASYTPTPLPAPTQAPPARPAPTERPGILPTAIPGVFPTALPVRVPIFGG
ncbi:MAG: protein kinase domain-containing protein [Chloroflexota bacterium]